ncbi:hypothetical protein ABEY52_26735 [Priestia aryabhattai]
MAWKVKMTVEEAQKLAKECIESAIRSGFPLKNKEKPFVIKEKDTD